MTGDALSSRLPSLRSFWISEALYTRSASSVSAMRSGRSTVTFQ